jgi:hypothetical protein
VRERLIDLQEPQLQLILCCLICLIDDKNEPDESDDDGFVGVLDLVRVLVD